MTVRSNKSESDRVCSHCGGDVIANGGRVKLKGSILVCMKCLHAIDLKRRGRLLNTDGARNDWLNKRCDEMRRAIENRDHYVREAERAHADFTAVKREARRQAITEARQEFERRVSRWSWWRRLLFVVHAQPMKGEG